MSVRFDETQLEEAKREREKEAAMDPLERFKQLYRTFEDEDEAAAFVQTLAGLFEVKRRGSSSDDDVRPWLMRWCTLSPDDNKLLLYRDSTEGDIAETICLRGASVVQVPDGLPPDSAHLFRVCNVATWSVGLELRSDVVGHLIRLLEMDGYRVEGAKQRQHHRKLRAQREQPAARPRHAVDLIEHVLALTEEGDGRLVRAIVQLLVGLDQPAKPRDCRCFCLTAMSAVQGPHRHCASTPIVHES